MINFVKFHLPAIAYAGLIILLSSIPDLGTKHNFLHGYDKLIHFCEYAIFAVLIYRSISHISKKIGFYLALGLSLLFILMFAAFDELYQGHIPGRDSNLYDALFDFLGAVLIVLILALRHRRTSKSQ